MSQLLTEALLLASAGGLAGIVLGQATLKLLISRMSSDETVYFVSSDMNWVMLLFAVGLSIATGLLFGLYPAWDGSRASVALTLTYAAIYISMLLIAASAVFRRRDFK